MFEESGRERGVVLAIPEPTLAAATAERLRTLGWQVWRATSPRDARRLAWRHFPEAVVLPADGSDESGWLTCAKLLRAQPRLRVLLVGERTPQADRLARFVGAVGLSGATVGELVGRVEDGVTVA